MAKTQTAVQELRPIDKFKKQLKAALPTVMRMLPAHVTPEAFESRVVVAVNNNPKLLDCTTDSLLKACAETAELGLSLNPQLGEAWILPVWNSRISKSEAQLRPGYIGLMKLAKQSGEVKKIEAHVVYEGDDFSYEYGLTPTLRHIPGRIRGARTHAYCVWWLANGETQFEVMTADEVIATMERTSSKNKDGKIVGSWITDPDEMWRKTPVRRARKYMPQSAELFHKAVALDNEREFNAPEVQGEYTDITEAPATEPSDAAKTQTSKLEEKIGGKPAATATKQTVGGGGADGIGGRLEPPEDFGGPDYGAWRTAALVAYGRLNPEQRGKWRALHKDVLEAAEAADAAFIEGLTE